MVGDELLSGRRKDTHIPKTIELLGQRGLQLAYAHMVKDDRARLTQLLQQVFASGDVVMWQAGEPFEPQRPDNVQRLQMAMFPAGAQIIPNPFNRIAGFSVGHAHFFPGFPVMAHPMIAWVLDHFYPQWQRTRDWVEHALILPNTSEAVLTPVMESIEAHWPDVKIFSLPSVNHPVHGAHIELGVKGPTQSATAALAELQRCLGEMRIHHAAVT